jgi:hypothetical protein
LWCADGQARRHAQEFISKMLSKRWTQQRLQRIMQAWCEESQNTGTGADREELLTKLAEQTKLNKEHEDTIARYKELHTKTEVNLRKHEEILKKREKTFAKIEKERSELAMKLHAAEQEIER